MRGRAVAAAVAAGLIGGMALCAGAAHATPGKSGNWIMLVGACDGVPATVLDPPGPGPTAFSTLTGKMGVGRLFEWIYLPTDQVRQADEYGVALEHANQPNVTCEFPIPPEFSPDGTDNWLFRVTGFFRS